MVRIARKIIPATRMFAAVLPLTFFGAVAQSDTSQSVVVEPLRIAFEICLEVPQILDEVETAMLGAGWISDADAPMRTLFSHLLLSQWDNSKQPRELILGAHFMAASILGNSALTSEQPAYSLQELSISVINVDRVGGSEPYCVLTGPAELESTIASELDMPEFDTVMSRRTFVWDSGTKTLQAVFWDQDAVSSELEGLPAELAAEFRPKIQLANLAIITTPQ